MARAPRLTSVFRRLGTSQPRISATVDLPEASASPSIATEASGCTSSPSGYRGQGEGRDGHQATRGRDQPEGPSDEPTPPGVVVFRPARKRASSTTSYPRFLRQLSPNVECLVQPDPVTGKWPPLRPSAVAEPLHPRRPVDRSKRQPSSTAYADWLRDSVPAVEEVRNEPGAQEPPGADYEEAAE
jgi:hypothetical protein